MLQLNLSSSLSGLFVAVTLCATLCGNAFAASESVLWNFSGGSYGSGHGIDSSNPVAPLTPDGSGNLYGTAAHGGDSGQYACYTSYYRGCGTVFKLTPPTSAGSTWQESILWSFGNGTDGFNPVSGVILDGNGNLFGTTYNGGADQSSGIVFELAPPATIGGSWTEITIQTFNGPNGKSPNSLIMDQRGNLFGTTAMGGTDQDGVVFELTPPAIAGARWTETIIYSFGGSDGQQPVSLTMDRNGKAMS